MNYIISKTRYSLATILVASLVIAACGGDDTTTPPDDEPDMALDMAPDVSEPDMSPEPDADMAEDLGEVEAPVADAGEDQTGEVNQALTFDGSASSDPDGLDLTYEWSFVTQPDMSSATFDDPSAATAEFTPDQPGTYVVELEVDNGTKTATDRAVAEVAPEGGRLTSTVYVSPDGDDGNRGTEEAPLETFEAAIQVFRDEPMVERIELAAGPYDVGSTTFTISRDLDVSGPADAEAIINGSGNLFELSGTAFLTFVDVTLRSPEEAVDVPEDTSLSLIGVTCEADICVRAGALFSNNGGRVEVRRSLFAGITGDSSQGIVASVPEDITVVDTEIRDFGMYGIQVLNGPLTVRDSTINGNPTAINLVVNQTDNATLISNTTFDGNDQVLRNDGARNITIQGSTLSNSAEEAIVTEGGALVIRNSTIDASTSHGLVVRRDAIVTVRGSTISNSGDDGISVEGLGSRLDLGDDMSAGDNVISGSADGSLIDTRPDGATGYITMSSTELDGAFPPAGTYSGPLFSQYGILIANDTEVVVY